METRKIRHNILLRLVKFIDVFVMTFIFGIGCIRFYAPEMLIVQSKGRIIAFGVIYFVLFTTIGKVYEAFYISMKRISEIIYSQCLTSLVVNGIVFIIIWLMSQNFPNLLPVLAIFVTQVIFAFIWGKVSHSWYFRKFTAKDSAIVYDCRKGMDKLIEEYGLRKKYNVKATYKAEECVKDLSAISGVKTVFLSGVHSHDRNKILKYCMANDIEVFVIPRVGDVLMSGARPIHMFHLPMLQVKRYDATPEYLFVKRLMDIIVSLLGLIILSPVMLIVAIAIKAYDHGNVIYSHIRLTKDGKEFPIYKFRSMRTDAEKDGVARLSTGENDSRITPVGAVIRKLRLDELPQLVNILKGDLSLVGPRPERPEIAKQYEVDLPEFALRLEAKAGLTGYAQVYGKYNTTPYDKLQMDLMYIAHPSIIEDIKIMMATVKILFMPESTEGVEEGQTTAAN